MRLRKRWHQHVSEGIVRLLAVSGSRPSTRTTSRISFFARRTSAGIEICGDPILAPLAPRRYNRFASFTQLRRPPQVAARAIGAPATVASTSISRTRRSGVRWRPGDESRAALRNRVRRLLSERIDGCCTPQEPLGRRLDRDCASWYRHRRQPVRPDRGARRQAALDSGPGCRRRVCGAGRSRVPVHQRRTRQNRSRDLPHRAMVSCRRAGS